jgi:transcription-repair coupling factor (superfamily II helicase)
MAQALIKIAAARALREAPRSCPPTALRRVRARFPYDETEDQQNRHRFRARRHRSGRPMDRLVCGDVGFGKTEVALRAAFAAR